MSSRDRKSYLSATALTQELLDACQDNLECRLEMICEISTPDGGTIKASDRNKYVGGTFYEALLNFPVIGRTVGEWLANELQFSTLTLELSNVDGRFNKYLPGGDLFGSWIGRSVVVKLGLAELASTYKTIFSGQITDVGGFRRGLKSITIIARDDYDGINKNFPSVTFTEESYPKIEPKLVGKPVPVIYGDWRVATDPYQAAVPAFVVNGNDPLVSSQEKKIADITPVGSPTIFTINDHDYDNNDPVVLETSGTLPAPFALETVYYIYVVTNDSFQLLASPGGGPINITADGTGEISVKPNPAAPRRNIELVVSSHPLVAFTGIYLKRQDTFNLIPASEYTLNGGSMSLSLAQGGTWDGGENPYAFSQSDQFFCLCVGKSLGGDLLNSNIILQARDILITYGGVSPSSFDDNWIEYRDKTTPSQSATAFIKSRVWIGEQQQALSYALSMLEQVRLEAYINRDLKLKINSLHFDDWEASPSFKIKNWDVVEGSFQASIDDRNVFNAAQGAFNYLPIVNENAYLTPIYQNSAAIAQINKRIAKQIVFPNLYVKTDVVAQVREILRLSSASPESIDLELTWRSLLLDIGDFLFVDVDIESSFFSNVPCMIRDIGYDPDGLKIVAKLWSLAMVPFPGYSPGYAGTVGGFSANIVEEI